MWWLWIYMKICSCLLGKTWKIVLRVYTLPSSSPKLSLCHAISGWSCFFNRSSHVRAIARKHEFSITWSPCLIRPSMEVSLRLKVVITLDDIGSLSWSPGGIGSLGEITFRDEVVSSFYNVGSFTYVCNFLLVLIQMHYLAVNLTSDIRKIMQ